MKGRLLVILFLSILLQQCAKQTAPTGGPKDQTPPTLTKSNPPNKSVNFKGDNIELTFDELVQLNNPREQIIITPSIGKKFQATAKKNKVTLEFNSELQSNTTYTIDFRESIEDVNEKNTARAKVAFSTGSYLDSLKIVGSVSDILTDKILDNYTVAVTPASDTFNISKHPASWLTLTNKTGTFSIENLKPGKYLLYTFDDKNKNLIVDTKNEKYGFASEPIDLKAETDSVKLKVFKLDATKLKLISARPTFAYFNMRFSKSVTDYKISPIDSTRKIYSILESDNSTIKVFNTIQNLDSLHIRVQVQDSIANRIDTLIYLKFATKKSTKDKFTYTVNSLNIYEEKSQFSSEITFTKPIISFNTDSVSIQLDSLTKIQLNQNDYTWNQNRTKLTLSKKLTLEKPQKSQTPELKKTTNTPQLILPKPSIISVDNDTLPRIITPIKIVKTADNGMILTKIETNENFTLQLIDKNSIVISEIKNIKNHTFENIPAGNYSLRLLIDLNKNGKWDGGNYSSKQQPEPVVFYHNPKGAKDIFLKANWQVGPLLISY